MLVNGKEVWRPRGRHYKPVKVEALNDEATVFAFLYALKARRSVAKEWQAAHWFVEWRMHLGTHRAFHGYRPLDKWSPPAMDKHFHTLEEAEAYYTDVKVKVAKALARQIAMEAFGQT